MSPIQILAGAISKALLSQWSKITESPALQRANPTGLRMALNYIKSLESQSIEDRSLADTAEGTNHLWRFVQTVALIALLISPIIYKREFFSESFNLIYFIYIIVLAALRLYAGSLFEEKKYYLIESSEDNLRHSQFNALHADKKALSFMMSTDGEHESSSVDSTTDTDLAAMSQTALPSPPGITEVVLDNNAEEAFKEMRAHLTSVRRYHRIVLWLLIIAFLSFISLGFWKMLTSLKTTSDYFQAFGSAGIGGFLLLFGQRALYANRVSQLSLALFESYVAEARISLAEIPADDSPNEKRQQRAEVWKDFRLGVNQLWLSETRLSQELKNHKRPTKKANNSPRRSGT